MSLYETGARRAPAISCAFWLTLPDLMLLMALLILLCRSWPRLIVDGWSFCVHLTRLFRLGCHLSVWWAELLLVLLLVLVLVLVLLLLS